MRDEIDGRLWVAHGHQFSDDLHRLFVGIGKRLVRLRDIDWIAGWRRASAAPSRPGQA
jgi:hypothetical protein